MTDTNSSPVDGGYRQGRRPRQQAPRTRRVEFTLAEEEHALIAAAARRAGLAPAAYAATAVMAAAAQGSPAGAQATRRQALTELMRAAGLTRRIAVNLRQAAAALTAAGQPAGDLPACAAATFRRADRIDAAADAVRKTLP